MNLEEMIRESLRTELKDFYIATRGDKTPGIFITSKSNNHLLDAAISVTLDDDLLIKVYEVTAVKMKNKGKWNPCLSNIKKPASQSQFIKLLNSDIVMCANNMVFNTELNDPNSIEKLVCFVKSYFK